VKFKRQENVFDKRGSFEQRVIKFDSVDEASARNNEVPRRRADLNVRR
jgi:hypothetical protein